MGSSQLLFAPETKVTTPAALDFVADLVRLFRPRIRALLAQRSERAARSATGAGFDFLPDTQGIRDADWRCSPVPAVLADRRVEITGPVDRKMIINALNSGANVFMADFEDSTTPTLRNLIDGQINLYDAIRGTISFEQTTPGGVKRYALNEHTAVLFVRPRGLHLPEKHFLVDGELSPGSLFDFGLYCFHNAAELVRRGAGPFFYLPKLESHLEARLWNDVFEHTQRVLDLPRGTIKATVLIETLPAAFEMDEILYELRAHSAGLNCGRWDYIFSFIKKRAEDPAALLPDRVQVTMDKAFLAAYVRRLIATCHRRGVHAMGGMAAQIPIKDDPAANEAALAKVRADKLREVTAGHDGTWVAHPGLVGVAREVFDAHMPSANQIDGRAQDGSAAGAQPPVTRDDMLAPPPGTRTEAGLRHNIRVGILYLEAWLRGQGCVPIYNLMEDAATAEISRAQVWQWIHHKAPLETGEVITPARLAEIVDQELAVIAGELARVDGERFASGKFAQARQLFERLATAPTFEEFLTLPAYELIT